LPSGSDLARRVEWRVALVGKRENGREAPAKAMYTDPRIAKRASPPVTTPTCSQFSRTERVGARASRDAPFAAVRCSLLALLALTAISCDEGDAHFTINFASDFSPAKHAVSVLGVYKDGQMSAGGWEALAPRVSPAICAGDCEVGYNALVATNGALADAIDAYAQANGPTDDLLGQLAPAAKGDLVLVITFAGKLPVHGTDGGASHSQQTPAATGGRGGGRRGRMGGGRSQSKPESPPDTNLLDVSASLFSISRERSVAEVGMQYTGTSIDDAIARFAAKLRESLPNMVCAGWNWGTAIDPDAIRKSINQ
jgi:hypothetical protein